MDKTKISIIASLDKNKVIGSKNGLLWHIPEDLKRFKKLTSYHAIIMGRKTFDSIGRALPNRLSIVITHDLKDKKGDKNLVFVNSLKQALKIGDKFETSRKDSLDQEIFIIGGGQIYKQALSIADKLYLTLIDADFEGDTYFPDYSQFSLVVSKQKIRSDRYDYVWIDLAR